MKGMLVTSMQLCYSTGSRPPARALWLEAQEIHSHGELEDEQQQQPEASPTTVTVRAHLHAALRSRRRPIARSPHKYSTHNALPPCERASTGTESRRKQAKLHGQLRTRRLDRLPVPQASERAPSLRPRPRPRSASLPPAFSHPSAQLSPASLRP
ncbi:hypothetical protein NUW54_g9389 [Trametes sanguinea]|uniref:Uncharacterized protein n=1 Tax=Trametes sanguinea TaxID=158606 RepID=A0ACC1P7J9_9APHY|nr:hypothetical protein NUW54_g9389 [Trametes sanguinea]